MEKDKGGVPVDEGMFASMPALTMWAAGSLLLGKFTGLVAMGIMWVVPRWITGSVLVLAFGFVAVAIVLAGLQMRRQSQRDKRAEDLLDEMLDAGLLSERLRARGYVMRRAPGLVGALEGGPDASVGERDEAGRLGGGVVDGVR